jgi:transposase
MMFGLTVHHQYYLYRPPTDMRKGFDGLCGVIHQTMDMNPLDGSVYIFINRRRDRMKLLVWESSGFVMYYKRLERGTFELPASKADQMVIHWEKLMLMIQGISLQKISHRKRYYRA